MNAILLVGGGVVLGAAAVVAYVVWIFRNVL